VSSKSQVSMLVSFLCLLPRGTDTQGSHFKGTIIVKEPGENITLKCSSEGCLQSNVRYAGMYLYHEFTERNEVYYCSNHINSKITVRSKYKGRIWTNGTPMSHDITITSLTLDDSGVYTCDYKESFDTSVNNSQYCQVKQRSSCKRKARNSLQESSDYVYEVMMKTNVYPAAAPEQSSRNPYEFD
uniref:Ig-like domain-containing protein n=1 Tax=Amphilophus citrinellus TaxID=61819 RepID=A0A3Q0RAJ2_AMPCI